ncbi:MAG: hypothetical protein Tsb0019_00970 [Roseibium sp.]
MTKQRAKKSVRDIVRDTFTPSRVGLLSWAFAAIFMGAVGFASYQFSYLNDGFMPGISVRGGLALPSGGDVESTASVSGANRGEIAVDVLPGVQRDATGTGADLSQGQIDVLQREVVGLRRRLSALAEQNLAYSRRIAALEQQVAIARLSGTRAPASANDTGTEDSAAKDRAAEPGPGVVITTATPPPSQALPPSQTAPDSVKVAPEVAQEPETLPGTDDAPEEAETGVVDANRSEAQTRTAPRLISIYRTQGADGIASADPIDPQEPVRIVQRSPAVLPVVTLPEASEASEEPVTTGSIPTLSEATLPEDFDATPTRTTEAPKIVEPSGPAGRLHGGGDVQLKRSDFGAIIGHYRTNAAAAKAWADFKTQNVERMRDLRPLLMERQSEEGGVALMVGPFANAADAAVACLQLLAVTDLCRPALYAGDPLVTAAEFRDSAF